MSAGEKELKDVRLAQSTLQDVTTFLQLDATQLQLCAEDGKCDTGFDVPANTTRRFTLKIAPGFGTPGIFTGEIAVRIAGKPETQSFKLTVYSRSHGAMVLGGFLIVLGLGLYFVINVLLRRRITIDEALLPAYQLQDTLRILRTRVDEASALTHVPMAALTAAIDRLDTQLTPQALATHLPPIMVSPWSSGTTWLDTFKVYLTPISDRAEGLVVLVNSGVQVAIGYWATFPAPVALALGQINALAPTATNAATAQTSLAPILQALQAAVSPPPRCDSGAGTRSGASRYCRTVVYAPSGYAESPGALGSEHAMGVVVGCTSCPGERLIFGGSSELRLRKFDGLH